jgi:hypothetical protein
LGDWAISRLLCTQGSTTKKYRYLFQPWASFKHVIPKIEHAKNIHKSGVIQFIFIALQTNILDILI